MSRAFGTRQWHCCGCASDASCKNDVTRTNDANGTLSVIPASGVIQPKTDVNESAASPRKADYRLERPLPGTASPHRFVARPAFLSRALRVVPRGSRSPAKQRAASGSPARER